MGIVTYLNVFTVKTKQTDRKSHSIFNLLIYFVSLISFLAFLKNCAAVYFRGEKNRDCLRSAKFVLLSGCDSSVHNDSRRTFLTIFTV